MKFNTAIAAMMSFANDVTAAGSITKDEYVVLLKLLCPFAPHIAEEMYERMGGKTLLSLSKWPEFDLSKTVDSEINIAVQVCGKLRSQITVPADVSQEDAVKAAESDEKIASLIAGKTVVKTIYVPKKLVNIVIK